MPGKIARLLGIVFILVGILGFVPSLTPGGNLLGYFPVNTMHNIVHIALGLWGLAAAGSGAVMYLRALTVIYGLLAILGSMSATENLFGMVPLGSYDVWLHAALAVVAGYFGFGPGSKSVA